MEFSGKILVIGCGGVAQCVLPILLKLIEMPAQKITVIDFEDNRHKIAHILEKGVRYVQQRITSKNYGAILQHYLSPGDICLDLAWNLDTCALVDWCHHHNVSYLNTSVEVWNPFDGNYSQSLSHQTLYSRHMALREMIKKWGSHRGPTIIVDHGANPGLVSHFTKQALLEIGEKIISTEFNDKRKAQLTEALSTENFPALAYLTGVKTIHISERDTQITKDPKQVNEFVNTWSVCGLIEEGLAPAELGWGTHEKYLPHNAVEHHEGPKNQIFLAQRGVNTWVRSWVPSNGEIIGMVIRHGEAFSISESLTIWQDGKVSYRPTVHYAYCPCDSAINSLHELKMRSYLPQEKQRILNNEIISGIDELGCLLMGHDLNAWWIGTILDIETARKLVPGQNATTVQVAGGVAAAIVYMIKHPNEGFCLPDHLNHREILEVAKPYLGQFVSRPVDWSPLRHAEKMQGFKQPTPPKEDEWQFPTFLVH